MPIYDFKCNSCGHEFDLIESVHEHDEHKEKCPKCKSKDIERVLGAVSVQTSKKS
jgi:putative FmdB family regulatory protein